MTRNRAPMKTPTKAQLQARVEYYENALKNLIQDPQVSSSTVDGTAVASCIEDILDGAPSLNPADAPVKTRGKRNEPPADASENLADGEQLVEVELRVGDEAAE